MEMLTYSEPITFVTGYDGELEGRINVAGNIISIKGESYNEIMSIVNRIFKIEKNNLDVT